MGCTGLVTPCRAPAPGPTFRGIKLGVNGPYGPSGGMSEPVTFVSVTVRWHLQRDVTLHVFSPEFCTRTGPDGLIDCIRIRIREWSKNWSETARAENPSVHTELTTTAPGSSSKRGADVHAIQLP